MPKSIARRFDRYGVRVIHGYGMKETTPVVGIGIPKAAMEGAEPERLFTLLARQGYPLPFVDIRVRGDRGDQPWDGKSVAELQVRRPWIAARYFEDTASAGKWTEDGWLRTGASRPSILKGTSRSWTGSRTS